MRRSDIRPQVHVACFDAQTGHGSNGGDSFVGRRRPARGFLPSVYAQPPDRCEGETLYYNTNLGAPWRPCPLAGGQIPLDQPLSRVRLRGDLAKARPALAAVSSTPCVYDRGTLLVAPADSPRIFAFDAATGQMLWQTGERGAGRRSTCWARPAITWLPAAGNSTGSA